MSLLYTWNMILNKITEDCDLITEPMISTDELLGYANEAIESSETAVHTIGIEDTYFLAWDYLYLIPGTYSYDLPANIYANKIRKMFYSNPAAVTVTTGTLVSLTTSFVVASASGLSRGMAVIGTGIPATTKVVSVSGTTVVISKAATASGVKSLSFVAPQPPYGGLQYEVRKIRNLIDTQFSYPGDNYGFLIFNMEQEEGGNQVNLYPTPSETGPLILEQYIRQMRRLTSSLTDPYNVCELPECVNYLFQYMKWKIAVKRRLAEVATVERENTKIEYNLLQETFKEMVPDGNNKIPMDFSSYYNQELDLYY